MFAAWVAELMVGVGYQTSELIVKAEAWGQGERSYPGTVCGPFAVAAARGGQQIDFVDRRTGRAAISTRWLWARS